ncbi:MAG TPA: phosphodiesterase, partial [Steroidobacteraceae bacterium]|nr:phosphodiesterase [Steroidobacteraceae bacterium]
FATWLRSRQAEQKDGLGACLTRLHRSGCCEVALPLVDSQDRILAVLGVGLSAAATQTQGRNPGRALRQRLKPVLDCLHREIAAAARARSRVSNLTGKTQDLEWLFALTGATGTAAAGEGQPIQRLLAAAAERMRCALAVLLVPDQKLTIEQRGPGCAPGQPLQAARARLQDHLLAWAQRKPRPLIANKPLGPAAAASCKMLAVPVIRGKDRSTGVLLFMNAVTGADFVRRQAFLAAHIARHVGTLLDSSFDLATGLFTRAALEEAYEAAVVSAPGAAQCLLHIDIDQLHVVNEVHGYQAGDDLIIRLAQLLTPPLLPEGALAARISGDRFVVVLPGCDAQATAAIAERLQKSIAGAPIGEAAGKLEATLSCGITEFLNLPQGLTRALAAAETACQAAKDRGRNRIETYACDDSSIMQRHGDVFIVGGLRDALKHDRFELYAQAYRPLRNAELAGGYEVLLRLRNPDGSVGAPGEFFSAAQRYQLLPSIDRWVVDHALDAIDAHCGILVRRGISISVNVSGPSLGDDHLVDHLLSRLKRTRFAPRLLTVEITEQSAVRNLANAARMMKRLREAGCGVALDDFGTGANSLVYLRELPLTRVKIDGSFVRDLLASERSVATVRAILQLVRAFPVDTVAEYVETEAVAGKLRMLGVDYAQGYLYGKPQLLESVLHELERDESRRMHAIALEI